MPEFVNKAIPRGEEECPNQKAKALPKMSVLSERELEERLSEVEEERKVSTICKCCRLK